MGYDVQKVRADFPILAEMINGKPLVYLDSGATAQKPAVVMVNLLGTRPGTGRPEGLAAALSVEDAHVHLYGKASAGAGRKLGHVTARGANLEEALGRARRAAAAITFGDPA